MLKSLRKDLERAFGVLVSRSHILRDPCLFWDRRIIVDILLACVILHNMIVEARWDAYESKLFTLALAVVENGIFLDEKGNKINFTWRSRESVETGGNPITGRQWAQHLGVRELEIIDKFAHSALKHDLDEHTWSNWGLYSLEAE